MKKRIITVGLVCLTVFAWGQDRKALTLDEALEITLSRNPAIRALDYEEEAAEREKKAAFGLRLPTLTAAGTYVYLDKDIALNLNHLKGPVGQLIGELPSGLLPPAVLEQAGQLLGSDWRFNLQDRNFGAVGATATIPVYTGGKINAANNAARIRMEEAAAKGDQGRDALVSELTERYFGLSLSLQVVEVRRQVWEGMQHHLSDARELERNGIISKAERLYAEVHTAEAERDYLKAQQQVEILNSALGNTLNTEGVYQPISNMFILSSIEPVEYFKTMAGGHNPLLKQVSLNRDLAVEGVRLQRADFAPQFALTGSALLYNYQVTNLFPRWAIGAGVSLKIFDGLHREYKFSAAKSQVRRLEAINTTAGNNILTLIDKLYNEMTIYHRQLASIDAANSFALEYLRIKEEAFREGVAPSSEVVDARLNLAKIKVERLQAGYYYDLMLARLLEAAGISDRLTEYARRPEAVAIRFE